MNHSLPLTVPFSEEAERAILGCLLIEPALFDDLPLFEHHFHLSKHRVLFRAANDLHVEGSSVDVLTLTAFLEPRDQLQDVGGSAYIAALDIDLPDPGRAENYFAILDDRYRRRALLEETVRLSRSASDPDTDPTDVANQALRRLDGIQASLPDADELGLTYGLDEARTFADERFRIAQETGATVLGIPTGFPTFDKTLGGLERGLYALAGEEGLGKTAWAFQAARYAARTEPVIYATFENSRLSLSLRALCSATETDSTRVRRGQIEPSTFDRAIADYKAQLGDRLLVVEADSSTSVAFLRATARRAMERHRSKRCLVVVDYLQMMAKSAREFRGISDEIGRVEALVAELVYLSKNISSPVIALSGQNRAGRGTTDNTSFKGSGLIEYSADVTLFLSDDEDRRLNDPLQGLRLTVQKNRDGKGGWSVPLIFNKRRQKMTEEEQSLAV